jgi:hypothetical protein
MSSDRAENGARDSMNQKNTEIRERNGGLTCNGEEETLDLRINTITAAAIYGLGKG